MKILLVLVMLLVAGILTGCSDAQQNQNTLTFLQQGKAKGHAVVTTDAGGEFSMTNAFRLGASGTTVSFDGNIDFSGE